MATTNSPLTAPPRSEIWRARFKLVRAALAVRMLLRTATTIPTTPAVPEQRAPKRNDRVVVSARMAAGGSLAWGSLTNA
ncbi:hypothetical protein HRbin33_00097 [bacterium HR33]|nr:hypothetical protein HRbin33_00097 [bacterium HR33]